MVSDITDVKQAQFELEQANLSLHAGKEESLRTDKARFSLLASATFEGVALTRHGVIADCNEQMQTITGYTREELVGMKIADFMLPEELEPVLAKVNHGHESLIEHSLIRKDGSRILVEAHGKNLDGDRNSIRVTALRDITERKRAEQALLNVNAELKARTIEAETASATKSLFLSNVSHELRTPLHTILGYARLLLNETEGGVRRKLEIIERNTNHLHALIEDLLDFNLGVKNVRALVSKAVNIRELIEELELSVQLLAERHDNRFSVMLADDIPAAVFVDENRLIQVLQNLIGNACKYTRNGLVTLSINRADQPIESRDEGHCQLRFVIEDNGVGIAAEDRERIFSAFSRGTSSFGQPGLGLGLTIAQQWVKTMGGHIQLESEFGRGSRFFFTLTFPTAQLPQEDQFARVSNCNHRGDFSRTVLVVDDIAENRLYLRELCESWGYKVLEAIDGVSAIAACMIANPPVDAILADQFMRGMDGWEVLKRIRKSHGLSNLPMVLISASHAQRPSTLPQDVHFDLLLNKPFEEQDLACFLCGRLSRAPESCRRVATVSDTHSVIALPAEELEKFRYLLSLGMVVRIEEWAQQLAVEQPVYTDFAGQVEQYCQSANLTALEKLGKGAVSL